MRVLIVGLAVTLMATTALAGSAHITLTVGGESSYEPTPGETFTVDVNITTSTGNMTAWGTNLLDQADAGYTIAAGVIGGYQNLFALDYADSGPPYANSSGWSCKVADAEVWSAGDVDAAVLGTVADVLTTGATTGWCASFDLTAPSTKSVVTEIQCDGPYAGDMDYHDMDVDCDPLILTPEPTSALLLLGALPLLRRRR